MASFTFDLLMIPAIALGVGVGIIAVKRIPEKAYRYFVMTLIFISSLLLFA